MCLKPHVSLGKFYVVRPRWLNSILKLFWDSVSKVGQNARSSAFEDLMTRRSETVAVQEQRRDLRHVPEDWRNRLQIIVRQIESCQALQSAKPIFGRIDLFDLIVASQNYLEVNQIVDWFRENRETIVGNVNFSQRDHQTDFIWQRLQLIAAQIQVLDVIKLRHKRLHLCQSVRVHVQLGNHGAQMHQTFRQLFQLVLREVND